MRGGRQTQKEQDLEGETYMVKMGGVGGGGVGKEMCGLVYNSP